MPARIPNMAETGTAQDDVRRYTAERLTPLLAMMRDDGAYPYRNGGAGIAECTCYALLARYAAGDTDERLTISLDWLQKLQRPDGGFAPQTSVSDSNWVTSLAALTMGAYGRSEAQRKAVEWLLGLTGMESAWLPRTIRNTLGIETAYPQNHHGWPWVKGTAAWLMPTALGLLALLHARKSGRFDHLNSQLDERIDEARKMLLDRRCADGGWNHGAPAALEVNANSYPETTGMALIALQGVPSEAIAGADDLGAQMLSKNHFANAASWLQIGLTARGHAVIIGEEEAIQCRNSLDYALRVLALQAIGGNNILRA